MPGPSVQRAIYGRRLIIFACSVGSDVHQSPYSSACVFIFAVQQYILAKRPRAGGRRDDGTLLLQLQNYISVPRARVAAGLEFSLYSFDMDQTRCLPQLR